MASSAADFSVVHIDYVDGGGPGIPKIEDADVVVDERQQQQQLESQQQLINAPGWEEEHIETFLRGAGAGLHLLVGAGETDFYMTRTDLDRIAPPLTRILNRYEPTLRASEYADPILVTHGVVIYTWRSMLQRAQARREAEEAGIHFGPEPEPETIDFEPELEEQDSTYVRYADRRRNHG